jgi:hypothetical protein
MRRSVSNLKTVAEVNRELNLLRYWYDEFEGFGNTQYAPMSRNQAKKYENNAMNWGMRLMARKAQLEAANKLRQRVLARRRALAQRTVWNRWLARAMRPSNRGGTMYRSVAKKYKKPSPRRSPVKRRRSI